MKFRNAAIIGLGAIGLASCQSNGELVVEEGVGVTALRTVCPAVGVPDYTGDITLFSPDTARTQDALDVSATITNVRSTCNDTSEKVYAQADFDVVGLRRNVSGARSVQLPYYSVVVRGGSAVVAKRVGIVTLNFADGQARATARASGGAYIDKAEATLPDDIRDRITRRRRAGEAEAAVDPLSEPAVRAAIARASFELLVGFNLTQDQLAYNVTR